MRMDSKHLTTHAPSEAGEVAAAEEAVESMVATATTRRVKLTTSSGKVEAEVAEVTDPANLRIGRRLQHR